MPDRPPLPDDFPLPEKRQDIPPWAQRAAPGAGGGDRISGPPRSERLPEKVYTGLERHELATAISDQADLVHYGVPTNYQPPQGNQELTLGDNAEIWQCFCREDLYDTRRLTLEQVHLFEWFPLSPGRFHTPEAAANRRMALEALMRTPEGQAYFTPRGKASMIAGGLGAVRLRPRLIGGEPHYFMTVSSTGVCHEGFPVLVPRRFYAQLKPRLLTDGAVPVTLSGEMRYLSGDLPDFFGQKRTLPRLLLHVDRLEVLPASRARVTGFLITAAVAFLGQVEGQVGPYMTYASFDPARREALEQAVVWIRDFYVQGQYQGQVITDFDEVMPRFPQAVFGLADVMAGRLAADRVQAFLQECHLPVDDTRPYFIVYNQTVKQIHTEGGAYVDGNVNTGGGDFVGRDKKVSAGERGVAIGGNVSGSTIVTGDRNIVSSDLRRVFASVYQAIKQSDRPVQEKADLHAEVEEIEDAVRQPPVDESWLARRLRTLKRMAPDIAGVLLVGLSGPQAVVAETVRKIAARVQQEG